MEIVRRIHRAKHIQSKSDLSKVTQRRITYFRLLLVLAKGGKGGGGVLCHLIHLIYTVFITDGTDSAECPLLVSVPLQAF